MKNLEALLRLGGVLHLGLLVAAALVPRVLDWRAELARVGKFTRQVIWVHGVFIALTLIGFGVLSLFHAPAMADGSPLARSVCGFIAFFWLARLGVQFFYFEAGPHLANPLLKLGYNGLTCVFAYFAVVYGWAALGV